MIMMMVMKHVMSMSIGTSTAIIIYGDWDFPILGARKFHCLFVLCIIWTLEWMMAVCLFGDQIQTTQSAKIIILSVNLFLPPSLPLSSNHHFVERKEGNFNYLNSWEH
jgi:hypothetical protein